MISRTAFKVGLSILASVLVFISTTALFTLAAWSRGEPLWYGPASGAIVTIGAAVMIGLAVGVGNFIWWFEQKYVKRPF